MWEILINTICYQQHFLLSSGKCDLLSFQPRGSILYICSHRHWWQISIWFLSLPCTCPILHLHHQVFWDLLLKMFYPWSTEAVYPRLLIFALILLGWSSLSPFMSWFCPDKIQRDSFISKETRFVSINNFSHVFLVMHHGLKCFMQSLIASRRQR